jgi:hypothetical protein
MARKIEIVVGVDSRAAEKGFKSLSKSAKDFRSDLGKSVGGSKLGIFGGVGKAGAIGAGVAIGTALLLACPIQEET